MMNKAVTSINDSFVNQENSLILYKSTIGLTPQDDGNDIDDRDGLATEKMLA